MHSVAHWMIVPAAGSGSRMQMDKPKQYLQIGNKTLLEHTLERLLKVPGLQGIVVLVNPEDTYWQKLEVFKNNRVKVEFGGKERCDSVLNGLDSLQDTVAEDDWVLVHDAARPCVDLGDIGKLLQSLKLHPVGGLLGAPVSDTIKQVEADGAVELTLDRSQLWRAFTPQMFRYGVLCNALQTALQRGKTITDEASAIESMGFAPVMIEGSSDNIKVTCPADLSLAELLLKKQELDSL